MSAILILGFETGFKRAYYLRNAKASVCNFKNSPTSVPHVICRIHCSYAAKLSPIKLEVETSPANLHVEGELLYTCSSSSFPPPSVLNGCAVWFLSSSCCSISCSICCRRSMACVSVRLLVLRTTGSKSYKRQFFCCYFLL